jgi:hypothetical protein
LEKFGWSYLKVWLERIERKMRMISWVERIFLGRAEMLGGYSW